MSDARFAFPIRRSWQRPHLSAIVVGFFAALCLAFWNSAGRQHADRQWHFGWPWEYAQCHAEISDGGVVMNSIHTYPFEARRSFLWNKWQYLEVAWQLICLDILICAVLTLFIAGMVELWRRQRRHVSQLYLREVLGACALLCVVLAIGMQFAKQTRKTAESVARLTSHTSKGGGIGIDYGLPSILRQNLPEGEFQPFDRIVYASSGIRSQFDDEDFRFLAAQPHLRSVELKASPGCGTRLASLSSLSSIALWTGHLSDDDIRAIARIQGLQRLRVQCTILPPQVLPACSEMCSLRQLSIRGQLLAFRAEDSRVYDYPTAQSREDIKVVDDLIGDLRPLLQLTSLESLELGGFQVQGGTLLSLAGLKRLRSLDVRSCGYDPLELEQLRSLRADVSITGR